MWMWLAWRLPKKLLLFAIIRGFADATTGKWGTTNPNDVDYKMIYDRIIEKYNIK